MKKLVVDDIKKLIKKRDKNSHKGTYGKTLIIGSSKRYIGAGVLCAKACMCSGSGLVTLAVEDDIFDVISQKMLEVMVLDIDVFREDFENLVRISDSIAIGCGLGIRDYTLDKMKYIFEHSNCDILIDADGLNMLSENMDLIRNRKNKNTIILTPHYGEFARLSNLNIEYIQANKVEVCEKFAQKYENIILILKGSSTIITNGKDTFVSDIGVPQMATGGMGDCLCGMITSFVGQGYESMDSCKIGVFLHSYIANNLSKKMNSILASDIISNIQTTLKSIQD